MVPSRSASRSTTAGLSPSGMPSGPPPPDPSLLAEAESGLLYRPRIQERGALRQPPEPLRLPAPLSQLPWDIAQDEFGVKGADFIGVMGALLLQAAQDQFKAYRIDSTTVADTLPPPSGQDQIPLRPD